MWPRLTARASAWQLFALFAISALLPLASGAGEEGGQFSKQLGEDRWVPSLALTAGFTIQTKQTGAASSATRPVGSPTFTQLRESAKGSDTAVSPFIGWAFEIMTPAFDLPSRPRLFFGADYLPTFAPIRTIAVQGDPDCVRGPEPNVPCAQGEDGSRRRPFGELAANGLGTKLEARMGTWVLGAHLGVAFPVDFGGRQLRIKPSFGWMNFKVSGSALVVDAACDPVSACTDYTFIVGFPPLPGFLRETTLTAYDSRRYNAIGPGLDVEMDTGRVGPIGVSLFVGARAYYVVDNRSISFQTTRVFEDQIGNDEVRGTFEVNVDKWIYRAHIGIRFQFIGM